LWNIRGLNQPGRNLSLGHIIRDNRLDFVWIQETKKEVFMPSFLKNLTSPIDFTWNFLSTRGTSGAVLVGVRDESLLVTNVSILKSSVSCMLVDRKTNFSWKLVVVYGSPYEEGKMDFIDELHLVMSAWQGPMVIGGDFNVSRFVSDKINGRINEKWVDCFNDWVNK
jgi:exonuclease III